MLFFPALTNYFTAESRCRLCARTRLCCRRILLRAIPGNGGRVWRVCFAAEKGAFAAWFSRDGAHSCSLSRCLFFFFFSAVLHPFFLPSFSLLSCFFIYLCFGSFCSVADVLVSCSTHSRGGRGRVKNGVAFAVFHVLIKVIFIPPQRSIDCRTSGVCGFGVQSGRWKGLLEQVTPGVYDD